MAASSEVPLSLYKDTIIEALGIYQEQTGGEVEFELEKAAELEPRDDKPYYARSESTVRHMGEQAATLAVIAFAPYEGTGDESTHNVLDIDPGDHYPAYDSRIVPRSKDVFHTEVYLPLSAGFSEYPGLYPHGDPVLFAGSLSLLGFKK
jgi:hypothetical protein